MPRANSKPNFYLRAKWGDIKVYPNRASKRAIINILRSKDAQVKKDM
jgi:hypothetical protein